MELNNVTNDVLNVIDSYGFKQEGAYNLRLNGMAVCHGDSRHIQIVKKEDQPGIDIHISGEAKNEQVHIPVVMTEAGVDVVYNDFYIGDNADVTIIAGCGIHNGGDAASEHDGIHRFFVGKNAKVKYVEKHYGEGDGNGKRILNPGTEVYMEENSCMEMEMVQIEGVDSTNRTNCAEQAYSAGTPFDPRQPECREYLHRESERRGFQRGCGVTFRCQGYLKADLQFQNRGQRQVQRTYGV